MNRKIAFFPLQWLFLLTTAKTVFGQGEEPGNIVVPKPSPAIADLGALISAGITAAIVIAGLLTFLFLVWGGLEWLTSGGDKAKYEAARDRITAAIIGLAIVIAAWAIMQLIAHFFGFKFGTFNIPSVTDIQGK